mmetsp:Transcript_24079/g.57179  ORF Transcript_24079/g.57179 Transcript_24079/m.57179 type:complete len:204 (+) Transcript_24079:22-633(+)
MAARSPRALRHLACSTERRVRVFKFGAKLALMRAATSPPSDVLHLSGMSRKKSHVGRNSKGSLERRPRDGLDGAASPFKARGARPSRGRRREPYRAHRAPRVPRETLDRSSVCELAGGCARCEGAPRGRAWRRRRRFMLGKKDEQGRARQDGRATSPSSCSIKAQHDSAKFGGMIFERDYIIARDPTESGRCDDPTESGRCDS